MRTITAVILSMLIPSSVLAQEDREPPESVEAARALLDAAAEAVEAYGADPDALAAAPDAIRQAGEAIGRARALLDEGGVERADLAIRRVEALIDLIAELIEARSLEKAEEALAERVVRALERLAVAKAAYASVTEQLHLFAVPFPGEEGR